MSELKACPFCGKEMQKYDNCGDENTVWCANCGAIGPNELTPTRAIEFWNLRRIEDALRAESERLKSTLIHVKLTFDLWQQEGSFWTPAEVDLLDIVNKALGR